MQTLRWSFPSLWFILRFRMVDVLLWSIMSFSDLRFLHRHVFLQKSFKYNEISPGSSALLSWSSLSHIHNWEQFNTISVWLLGSRRDVRGRSPSAAGSEEEVSFRFLPFFQLMWDFRWVSLICAWEHFKIEWNCLTNVLGMTWNIKHWAFLPIVSYLKPSGWKKPLEKGCLDRYNISGNKPETED